MRAISIGKRTIGNEHPVFIIAEIGYNFNTLEEGIRSVDAAVDSGADGVKFQTFRAETIVSRGVDFPPEAGATSQFDEFKRYEMSRDTHHALFDHARARGVICFSTPSYYDDIELLETLQVPLYKIGSDDLTNLPFIDFVARKGKPVIMSTGMANLAEVAEAVETFRATGNQDLILLHCLSNYPVRDVGLMNLRAIRTLARAFQVPVGLSDHSISMAIPAAAVALGAVVIERHFTLSKSLSVPDAPFSADPVEFKTVVHSIREVERALGNGLKVPAASEVEMRRDTRKSVIARCEIPAGTRITREMLIVKRPGWGSAPKEIEWIIGRRAQKDIRADEPITWDKL